MNRTYLIEVPQSVVRFWASKKGWWIKFASPSRDLALTLAEVYVTSGDTLYNNENINVISWWEFCAISFRGLLPADRTISKWNRLRLWSFFISHFDKYFIFLRAHCFYCLTYLLQRALIHRLAPFAVFALFIAQLLFIYGTAVKMKSWMIEATRTKFFRVTK